MMTTYHRLDIHVDLWLKIEIVTVRGRLSDNFSTSLVPRLIT